jgi:hypothetical protein
MLTRKARHVSRETWHDSLTIARDHLLHERSLLDRLNASRLIILLGND